MNKLKFGCIILIGLCTKSAYAQQSIDAYVTDSTKNIFTLVASSSNSLSSPVDLDFYPDQTKRPNELWILNQGTSSTGGSTEIVFDANKSTRTYKYVKDGNAWHFMAMASALAFGNEDWATSADILDANRSGGRYTGPTLWPGDLSIYGVVGTPITQTANGSHLSMIHQSPYGKGIAFEKDLVFWVLDGYEGNIKRYDYGNPHQPGGDDHSGGSVRVYPDFKFTRHTSLPSHIVIDANKKYLYGCDPIGKKIFRIDITTGLDSGTGVKVNSEALVSYKKYTGLVTESIINTGLTTPVGIDIYGNRLIVTDNGSDQIIIYDISNNYSEVGRITLKYATSPDPMGIKVGPDGKIYFADKLNKSVYMIDNSSVMQLGIDDAIATQNNFIIYPNPVNSNLTLQTDNEMQNVEVKIINVLGEIVLTQSMNNVRRAELDVTKLNNGIYFLQARENNKTFTRKFIKQ